MRLQNYEEPRKWRASKNTVEKTSRNLSEKYSAQWVLWCTVLRLFHFFYKYIIIYIHIYNVYIRTFIIYIYRERESGKLTSWFSKGNQEPWVTNVTMRPADQSRVALAKALLSSRVQLPPDHTKPTTTHPIPTVCLWIHDDPWYVYVWLLSLHGLYRSLMQKSSRNFTNKCWCI